MEKGRLMALDYGEARTGVAVSDLLGITAQGIVSINHKSDKELLEKLEPLFTEYEIRKIILGLPLNMNNTEGPRVKKTKSFSKKLKDKFNIEIEFVDERLTTVASHRAMTEMGVNKTKKKKVVDTMSAILILQMYLDKNNK